MSRSQVAESSFSFLHMELVQMSLGADAATLSTSEMQHAGRKLEAVGFQVGQRLIERYTRDRPRFSDTLEIIKFICKDFWYEVYRKQIDKLQTNNRVRPSSPSQTCTQLTSPSRGRASTCFRTISTGCWLAARPGSRSRRTRSRCARCMSSFRAA